MRIKNFFVIMALVLAALTSFAKGGGKLVIIVDTGSWFPVEGCKFTVYPSDSGKPICTMFTDGNGKATSKKLPDGDYVVVNTQMTMGYENLGSDYFTIEGGDVLYNLRAVASSNCSYANGPDEGTVKVSISGTLEKAVLQAIEAFPHIAIADNLVQGQYFSYACPMVCAKNGNSANAGKAFKQYGFKAKLTLSGQLSFSMMPSDCIDAFAFGYYVDNALQLYRPDDFKATCQGKLNISDESRTFSLGNNGQFWLETFWGSQNFLFGGQSIALNDKWKGSGTGTFDGIESKISVSINKKTGKFKMSISSKDAVGVNVRYGVNPSYD